jgi:hypothetical protein
MPRLGLAVLWSTLALLAAGCATRYEVRTDWDETADYAALRSWTFAAVEPRDTANPLDNSLVRKRVDALLAKHLDAEGLTRAAEGAQADIAVRYWLGTRERRRIDRVAGSYHYWDPWGPRWVGRWAPFHDDVIVTNYTQGTVVVDLIDQRRNALVWRAYLVGTLSDDRKRTYESLDAALAQAFQGYPPR